MSLEFLLPASLMSFAMKSMNSSSQFLACPVAGTAHGAFWRGATSDVQDLKRSEAL